MLPLGKIIYKHGISSHCSADDTQLYAPVKPADRHQHNRAEEYVKDTLYWVTSSYLIPTGQKNNFWDNMEFEIISCHVTKEMLHDEEKGPVVWIIMFCCLDVPVQKNPQLSSTPESLVEIEQFTKWRPIYLHCTRS